MRKSVSMGLVAGVLGMGMANAEIKVSDKLSLSGFIDMSLSGSQNDAGEAIDASFDQFEISLGYKFSDALSAKVDLSQGGTSLTNSALSVEEANVTYKTGALALTTGRFLSSTGFEAAEPTGLYQYSFSVYCDAVNNPVGANCIYGGYQNGVALSYSISPMISVYGALVGSAAGIAQTGVDAAGSTSLKDPGVEVQVSLMPVEGVTVKAAYLYDALPNPEAYTLLNVWGSYAAGPLLVGAEFNMFTNLALTGNDGTSWLAMANYKVTDKFAATVRASSITSDLGEDETGIIVAPSYSLADNWFLIGEVGRLLDAETTTFGLESLLTF